MVSAPEELRLTRAMKRDGASEQQIRSRMAAQMNEDEKMKMADFVICNDGIQPLDEQISYILQILKTSKK
jgi:dephospho-CoA kinase